MRLKRRNQETPHKVLKEVTMTRIAIALLHRRKASSWSWAATGRPVPISLAGRGTSSDEVPLKPPKTEGELAKALDPLYKRFVPLMECGHNPPPSAIVTQFVNSRPKGERIAMALNDRGYHYNRLEINTYAP